MALIGWWNGTGEVVGTMPRRPNTPCKHPGCGRLVPYGTMYCEEHKPLHQHDRKTTAEKGYGSRWQKARAVYLHSHPLCVRCLAKGRYVKATVVDHIIPHRGNRELFWDRDNWAGSLQILPRFQNDDRGQIRGISLPQGAVEISVTLLPKDRRPLKRAFLRN